MIFVFSLGNDCVEILKTHVWKHKHTEPHVHAWTKRFRKGSKAYLGLTGYVKNDTLIKNSCKGGAHKNHSP